MYNVIIDNTIIIINNIFRGEKTLVELIFYTIIRKILKNRVTSN